ncbi:DNA primase [bacterium]|nr:MAG: DNA primase [bacterium]
MITEDIKEQIKEAADIVEVVSDRVKLKRSGNGFTGLCPFHNEKTPSFHVSPHLGIYKCFGCGRAGDVFNFVMDTEGVSFPEAMKALASRYNIFIPEEDDQSDDPKHKEKEGVFHALKFAAAYYHNQLRESEEGSHARSYLIRRGLNREIIKEYLLGYSLDSWHGLLHAAKSAGINESYLFQAGLLKESDRNKEPYDAFRGRVMFPIINTMGRVIGFGGRLMGDAKQAKYINSPQTMVYNKSEVLYGINVAKNEIRKHEEAILVEGYMDVLQMHQAGVRNVVSTSGTALTAQQVAILHRFGDKLTAIFDADNAGQNAMNKAIPIALEEGLGVNLLKLPDGEDPDSFVKQFGKDGFLGYKRQHEQDFIQFLVKSAQNREDWDNPRTKKQVVARAIQLIAVVKDPIERETMIQELHELTSIGDRTLFQELNQLILAKERKDRIDRRTAEKDEFKPQERPKSPSNSSLPEHLQGIPIGDEPSNSFDEDDASFGDFPPLDSTFTLPPKKAPKYEEEIIRLIFTANQEKPELMLMFVLDYIKPEYFESDMCRMFFQDLTNRFINKEDIKISAYLNREAPFPTWLGEILLDRHSISEKGSKLINANKSDDFLESIKIVKSSMRLLEMQYLKKEQLRLSEELKKNLSIELLNIDKLITHRLKYVTDNSNKLYPNPDWLTTE